MKGMICFFVVFLLVGGFLYSEQPRFYISADKIFSPGEGAYVTLECRGLPFVDIRVYKVADPVDFFGGQVDAHQPVEVNALSGTNSLDILHSVIEKDKQKLRDFLRLLVKRRLRTDIHGVHGGVKDVAIPTSKKSVHSQVKILKNYKLLRHFRHSFEGKSMGDWIYDKVDIMQAKPGVYLVEGVNGKHAGYTLVLVSKLAVITKQSDKRLVCYTVNKSTGEPEGNVSLTVIDNGTKKTLGQGKSDKWGLFSLDMQNISSLTVIAGKGKDYSIIDPAYFPVSVDHRKVYIYTDRPVYRPGQEVFFKGIVREFKDEKYKTVMDERVKVRVYGPKGSKITERELKANELGSFHGSFLLDSEPPVGTYKVVARVKNKNHQAEFKIKSYVKPKFKVDVRLDGSGLNGSTVKGEVMGKYYFGTPVKDASVNYYVYRTRFYVPWWVDEDYGWYYSESEYRSTRQELVTEGKGKLDAQGRFYFQFETAAEDKDYTYRVEARVKDPGNFTVTGNGAIKTSRGQFHLGLRTGRLIYKKGREVTVSFYSHNLNHKPVPAEFGFKAILMEPKGRDADGKGMVKETVIYRKQLETGENGRTTVRFKLKKNGHIKLVARGVDKFDNVIRGSTSIWSAKRGAKIGYGGQGLEIVADKLSYAPGDTARFLVLSRFRGIPFLFTVEGGDLYSHKVHRFSGNACVIETKLESRFSPNVYVQASTIFEGGYYDKRKTVIIPPVDKLLTVKLKTGKEIYKPGDTVTVDVAVTDHKKRAVQVELSLGVVDEAIYAVSPELTVAMQKFFYPRKRNNVRTHNSLTFNFYGYSREVKEELARLEMRARSGLASFKGSARSARRNFKDTCFWTPVVMTDKKGMARFSFNLPDNITQWRLTARCVNYFTQVGSASHKIISRKDLSIVMYPPLTFTQGDRLELPVLVKNLSNRRMEGSFDLQVKGGELVDPVMKKFALDPMGTAEINARINVSGIKGAKLGAQKEIILRASAKAGRFSDSMELNIPVTPFGVKKALNKSSYMVPGDTAKTIEFELPELALKGFFRGSLYVHNNIYRTVLESLNYLSGYPYGCVEQTMSRFLPDLVLMRALKKLGVSNEKLKKEADGYIRSGVSRLLTLQDEKGHWGWFRDREPDGFMTAYVVYGLTEARAQGYWVDDGAFRKGLDALERLLKEGQPDTVRIWCLYALAKAGRGPVSIISDEYKKCENMSNYSLAQLTLALWEVGKKEEAGVCADLLLKKKTAGKIKGKDTEVYWDGLVTYNHEVTLLPVDTTSMVMLALLKVKPEVKELDKAAYWLLKQKGSEHWGSTRDTAVAVMALSEYMGEKGIKSAGEQAVRFRLNGKEWRTVPKEILFSDKAGSFMEIGKEDLAAGKNSLEIEKQGGHELFANMFLSYYSEEEETKTEGLPLRVSRRYYRLEREDRVLTIEPVEHESEAVEFEPGEEFLVRLSVYSERDAEYMVLEDFIPAGFQVIENVRGYRFEDDIINERLKYTDVSHREVRDDRMVFFFDTMKKDERHYYYLMRAALKGKYRVNPAVIRSMYFDKKRALSDRMKVSVSALDDEQTGEVNQ